MEGLVRQIVSPEDLGVIVSNIGMTPDFSAIYTSNSGQHTAFVQVSLREGHRVGSYQYMRRVREKLADDLREVAQKAHQQFGTPWGLVALFLAAGGKARAEVHITGPRLVYAAESPLSVAQ